MVYHVELRVVFGIFDQKSWEIFGNLGRVRMIVGGASKCWVIFVDHRKCSENVWCWEDGATRWGAFVLSPQASAVVTRSIKMR